MPEIAMAGFAGLAAVILSFALDGVLQSCAWKLRTPFFRTLVIFLGTTASFFWTSHVVSIISTSAVLFVCSYMWQCYDTLVTKIDALITQRTRPEDILKASKLTTHQGPHAVDPQIVFSMQHGNRTRQKSM
jgi:hypothetical protein